MSKHINRVMNLDIGSIHCHILNLRYSSNELKHFKKPILRSDLLGYDTFFQKHFDLRVSQDSWKKLFRTIQKMVV